MDLHNWQAIDKDHSVAQYYLCVAKGDSNIPEWSYLKLDEEI